MAIISNLLRLIAKPIFLKLGKGLKSSKKQYCLGDEIDIRLDDSIVGKDNVIAKPPMLVNSLVRWVDGDAKQIKDSKTVQNDDGNTRTENSLEEKNLSNTIQNNSQTENSNASQVIRTVGPNSGDPFLHWSINGQRDFSAGIDNSDDDSFKICKNYFLDQNHFFRISSDGNNTHPFQYSAFAILSENTENINSGTAYYLGQGTPLTIIDNEGGNFFAGAGNDPSRPAMFTCKEKAKFLVYVSAVVNQNDPRADCEIQAAFSVQTQSGTTRNTGAINVIPRVFRKNTATVLGGVKAEAGDIIKFYIYTVSPDVTWFIERTIGATYTTYVGIYCLG